MTEQTWQVTVDKDLVDLIPEYLKNRREEVEVLRKALAAGDFEELRQRGHRMKGVGAPYGFDRVTLLGKQIEDSAKDGNRVEIENRVAEYAEYLARINIVYQ